MVAAMVAFWALVVLAVVWVFRALESERSREGRGAEETLERRLAAGEITVEEYRERLALLRNA